MSESEIAILVDRFMRRMQASIHYRAKPVDEHRVGPSGGILLLTLADIEPAPLHSLVGQLARDKSQITRAIQTLEQKGLVARTPSPDDQRVVILSLTPEGRRTVGVLRAVLTDAVAEVIAPLSAAEQKTLQQLLSNALDEG